jgi:hypothetical protein
MIDSRFHERRYKTWDSSLKPGTRTCRLCWRAMVLEPEQIEMTDVQVYARCQHCGGSFPIRHSDIEEFLEHHASIFLLER